MLRLVAKFKMNVEHDIARHKHGGGKPPKVSIRILTTRRLELEKNPDIKARRIGEMNERPILVKN